MKSILKIIDAISFWAGRVVSILVVIFMLIIGYEVVARYVFHAPTLWATETITILCGIYAMLGGAYTLYIKGHVSVDAIVGLFSPRVRAVIDLCTFPVAFVFFLVLIWTSSIYAWESVAILEESGTAAHLPVYPAKVVLFLASTMLCLQLLAKFIRDLMLVVTGKEYQ